MKYFINNIKINNSLENIIGIGTEVNVYRHQQYAAKIYHIPPYLSEEDCSYFIRHHRETKQIILPEGIIKNSNQQYRGHFSKYLEKTYHPYHILKMPYEIIQKNKKKLIEEALHLGKLHIYLDEFTIENAFLQHSTLYFYDFGRYRVEKEEVSEHNIEVVEQFFKTLKKKI